MVPEQPLTDYEREREERVARNREMLRNLGLDPAGAGAGAGGAPWGTEGGEGEPPAPGTRRKRSAIKDPATWRRSLRGQGLGPLEMTDGEKEDHRKRLEDRRSPLPFPPPGDAPPRRRGGPGVGRPVTWLCGGGQDPRTLVRLSLPQLRTLFLQIFGQPTSSNNGDWLRRKLAEPADADLLQHCRPRVGSTMWGEFYAQQPGGSTADGGATEAREGGEGGTGNGNGNGGGDVEGGDGGVAAAGGGVVVPNPPGPPLPDTLAAPPAPGLMDGGVVDPQAVGRRGSVSSLGMAPPTAQELAAEAAAKAVEEAEAEGFILAALGGDGECESVGWHGHANGGGVKNAGNGHVKAHHGGAHGQGTE